MFNHRMDEVPSRTVRAHWFLLSFNAGCINAGGFLATGRFVSHVTGFATLFGVDLARGQYEGALGILSVPIFFLLGSFIAGWFIDRPRSRNLAPHFDWVMGFSALCLFGAAAFGAWSGLSEFGDATRLKQAYLLLALLCLACGLQNAAITSSSGSSIRTTHLTGLTTDLGLGLARLLTIKPGAGTFKREAYADGLRAGSIVAFIVGSGAGGWLFQQYGYAGFLAPGAVAAYAAWQGRHSKLAPLHPPDASSVESNR